MFKELITKKYPIAVTCCDLPNSIRNTDEGLINNFPYTLLDMIDLDGTKMVKLYNPLSEDRYKGPWSDSDSRWTPALL